MIILICNEDISVSEREDAAMHGISLTKAPEDWEILQQENGFAEVLIAGTYKVHPAAIEVGVENAIPIVRVMRETDNMTVIPWVRADNICEGENFTGSFETILKIPAGGLYRIDTSLQTKSTVPDLTWLYRGDCVCHLGVGNLFVIAGQSNSSGYSRDFCYDPPCMGVHLFRNRGSWDLATHPMNESTGASDKPNEEMGVPGVSPYLSFGRMYQEITGWPVGLIQTSLGGSPMSRWAPETGDLYENMIDVMRRTGGKFSGIFWYQGCSDTDPEPAKNYFENFAGFVKAIRRELGYDIHFFTFQLNRQINGINDECWGMVREAQRRAAIELKNVSVLSTTNLNLSDGIHNSAQANVTLGEKLARQCAGILNKKEEFEAPSLKKAEKISCENIKKLGLNGEWISLEFEHVKTCFLLYSDLGADSGFTLEDEDGSAEIVRIRADREDGNFIYLQLDRNIGKEAYLSFAWQADPVRMPVVDEVTYLPPLSFYHVPVINNGLGGRKYS